MVTKRLPVGIKRDNWFDGMQVDRNDMVDEQTRNKDTDAANVYNFFSSGVIVNTTIPKVVLDTNSLSSAQQVLFNSNSFDGQSIYDNSDDVSDVIKGVLLSVTLSDVYLDGKAQTKISIIGDTFGDALVHDDLIFNQNGTQITVGRYKKIRSIIFSDFAGNLRGSIANAVVDGYLSGRCLIVEADALEASSDTILASQTSQPNKFFGDFVPASWTTTVTQMLDTAIRADDNAKSLADLDIGLYAAQQRELATNDVTTKIGQKFQADGNNIQKISILLSTKYDSVDGYDWSGSVVLSVYELQTQVNCPVSPVPDNIEDFDPDPRILGQLSLNKDEMEKQGIVLDGYSQIVDFVFTSTNIADPIRSPITPGNYYMFSIHRSGDTSTGTLLIEEAPHRADTGYMVVYDGSQWVNVKDSDMWYIVYGDYIKITDGVAYVDGAGIEVPRIEKDSTNTEAPYVSELHEFSVVTRDAYNYIIMDRESEYSDPTQDQRTGNSISSRVRPVPNFSLISLSNLNILLESNPTPLLIGCTRDRNPRANTSQVTGVTDMIGLVRRNEFNILYPDADIQQHNWVGSLLIPNSTSCCATYRIIKSEMFYDAYGDVNGDSIIDNSDIVALQALRQSYLSYAGTNIIDLSTITAQQFIADGYVDIEVLLRSDVDGNGIINNIDEGLIEDYVNKISNSFPAGSTFSRVQFTVENLTNSSTVNITDICPSFSVVPFVNINWKIEYFATWLPDLVVVSDSRRKLATTITDPVSGCEGGQNNFFIPGDVFLGGEMLNPDGTGFRIDFEMTHLSLHVPITDAYGNPVFIDGYTGILLYDTFVAEESGGKTISGFNAMKYSDNTYAQPADFNDGKIKIAPSIQSTASEFVVSSVPSNFTDILGLNYDPNTSLMTLYLKDGYEVIAQPSVRTKILVEVYLKKAGFKNPTQSITDDEMRALLGI